jgi:transcription factor C subunit 6
MSRRSTARRVSAKKRYTIDAFEGIEELQDAISEHSPVRRHSRDSDSADEFKIETEPQDAVEDEEEDDEEDEDVEAEVHSNAASDAGEKELDDAMSIAGDDDDDLDLDDEDDDTRATGLGRANPKRPKQALTGPDGAVYNRGLPDTITRKSGKADKRLFLFGSSVKEFGAIEKAFLKWNGQDTLPLHRKPDNIAADSFDYSYWQGETARKHEEAESWKWYFELGGKEIFEKRQNTTKLSNEDGRARVATSEVPERTFLMGPFTDPKLFRLRVGEALSLKDAWQQPQAAGFKAVPKNATRAGFILNLGTKIKCTEWAPNHSGTSQYLAISTLHPKELPKNIAPAYTPQPPYPAEIQIWKFAATPRGSIDSDVAPVLKHVFCTKWGDVKVLKWCPAPYERSSSLAKRSIGLLAGIWGDGGLRVIDLMDQPEQSTTNYLQLEKAAFESHPPDTLFSCVAWISANRIAAGCANGCVAIFDLSKHSTSGSPRPVSYTSIASSYVLSIASCYPSHPNLLITTAADGYPRLTDLNQPHPATATGTVLAPRSRATQNFAVWNDFCQNALVMDDNFALKGIPIRRFFTTISLGRARSVGTALATSLCHPFVLMGTAHGEVTGSNPTRRIVQPKAIPLLQTWFGHEWRRPTEAEASGAESSNPEDKRIGPHGLTRFIEGYKIEQGQRQYREGSMQNSDDKEHGLHFHTVHEEATAVTSLAWNPNRECGAWAVAGMADGLVRVEDLAAA